jgi:hypothetical protein
VATGFDPTDATGAYNAEGRNCFAALDRLCAERAPSKKAARAAAAVAVASLLAAAGGGEVDDAALMGALDGARAEELDALQAIFGNVRPLPCLALPLSHRGLVHATVCPETCACGEDAGVRV